MMKKTLPAIAVVASMTLAACSGAGDTAPSVEADVPAETVAPPVTEPAEATTPTTEVVETTVPPTLPPVEDVVEPVVAADDSVWVVTGYDINDPSRSNLVDLENDSWEGQDTSLADVEVYHAAMRQTQVYLQTAWKGPYDFGVTDRDELAAWVSLLGPTADSRWAAGPIWQDYHTTVDDAAEDYLADTVAAPDLRMVYWAGRPDAPVEERWYSDVDIEYMLINIVSSAISGGGNRYSKVSIERSPAGELRAVYVPWMVEIGMTINDDVPEQGRWVRIAFGTAKWVPTGDRETDLVLESPDVAQEIGTMAPVLEQRGVYIVNNDSGENSAENRVMEGL